jgi:hypothetical protein
MFAASMTVAQISQPSSNDPPKLSASAADAQIRVRALLGQYPVPNE